MGAALKALRGDNVVGRVRQKPFAPRSIRNPIVLLLLFWTPLASLTISGFALSIVIMGLGQCEGSMQACYYRCESKESWDIAQPSYYAEGHVPATITWDGEFIDEVYPPYQCSQGLVPPIVLVVPLPDDFNLETIAADMTLNGKPNDLIQNLNPISTTIATIILYT